MEVSLYERETINMDPVKSDIFSLGICALELKLMQFLDDASIQKEIYNIDSLSVEGNLLLYMFHPSCSIRYSEKEILSYLKNETKK